MRANVSATFLNELAKVYASLRAPTLPASFLSDLALVLQLS
jgi:hypothetical protein